MMWAGRMMNFHLVNFIPLYFSVINDFKIFTQAPGEWVVFLLFHAPLEIGS